jgi:putative membrane protein
MTTLTRFCCIGAAVLGLSSLSHAADTKVSHSDKSFFEKAAKSGAEEVAVSRAALPHLTNAQAKEFAQMMVTDHTGTNDELKALAAKKGVELPAKQRDTDKWSKTKKDYDADYIKKMVSDHEDAVDLFTKTSKSADDAEVQAFATKTLPTLQHHLTLAKDIKAALK